MGAGQLMSCSEWYENTISRVTHHAISFNLFKLIREFYHFAYKGVAETELPNHSQRLCKSL